MEDIEKIPYNSTLHEEVIEFIKRFYYSLQIFSLYPVTHPKIKNSIDILTHSYNLLLKNRERISFSTIKSDLLINTQPLEKSSQQVKDFAHFLYKNRISSITFTGTLDWLNLKKFMLIIANTKPKDGASELMDKIAHAGIPHIEIRPIDYKTLLSQRIQSSGFLKEEGVGTSHLVEYLLGQAEDLSQRDWRLAFKTAMEPVTLQSLLKTVAEDASVPLEDISAMIERLGILIEHYHEDEVPVFIKNLAEVLSSLNPELRIRILGHALERAKKSRNFVDQSVEAFSVDMLKEIIQSILHSGVSHSSDLLAILKRLSEHPQANEELASEIINTVSHKSIDPEMLQTFNAIFVKDSGQSEQQLHNHSYIQSLQTTAGASDTLRQEMAAYLKALEKDNLVRQLYKIQMDILRLDKSQNNVTAMKKGLEEHIAYMMKEGNPEKLLNFLLEDVAYDNFSLKYFLTELKGYEFLEELLYSFNNLSESLRWLLTAFLIQLEDQAVRLVVEVLAKDQNMVNRKRLVELLVSIGTFDVPYLIAQLQDDRWYLVRNIVLALGEIHDERAVHALIHILQHPKKTVVKEAILALGKIATPEVAGALAAFLQNAPVIHINNIVRVLLAQRDESLTVSVLNTLVMRKDLDQSLYEKILPKVFKAIVENQFNAAIPVTIEIYKNRKRLFSNSGWGEILIFQVLKAMNTTESLDVLKKLQDGSISGAFKRINPFL